MSTVAFGTLTTRREQSDSGKSTSTQPPGISTYIDVLAALVPAEVLGINALIISATSQTRGGPDPGTLRWAFWLLVGLAAVLFVLGRRPGPMPAAADGQAGATARRWQNWEWQDLVRIGIGPAALVLWTMAEPSGVWSAVYPGMSSGMRLLVPLVGAALLAAVTKALASHSDKKPAPAQRRQRATAPPATRPAPMGQDQSAPPDQPAPANRLPLAEQPALANQLPPAEQPALASEFLLTEQPEQPAPPEDATVSPLLPACSTAIDSVPKWVY